MATQTDCIFCKIASGEFDSWPVWQDENFLAFLTPFPNTPGFTVVIPKAHMSSDVLGFPEKDFSDLMLAAKSVAEVLKRGLEVKRVGLVIEGMGVDHAHVKLIPMHGIADGDWKPMLSGDPTFEEGYHGFLTTNDGPRMSGEELNRIQEKIKSSRNSE